MTTTAFDPFSTIATSTPAGLPRHRLSRDFRAGAYPVTPPVFANLIAAEDQLQVLAGDAIAPAETYAEFLKRLAFDLRDGKPLPEDVLEQARTSINLAEEQRLAGLLVAHLRDGVQARWKEALSEHADDMLVGLRPDLEEIVDAVRQAARAAEGLNTSDVEAVAAATDEQRAALGSLAELRKRYARLRGLQRQLVESASTELRWGAVFKSEVPSFSRIAELGTPEPADTTQWYRRLLDRDDVWIPTLPELHAALNPARESVEEPEPSTPWHERHNGARPPVYAG